MYLKKTPNAHGRIRLSIVDTYYDKAKKWPARKPWNLSAGSMNSKTVQGPDCSFHKTCSGTNEEKQKKQAPILFTFYDSD